MRHPTRNRTPEETYHALRTVVNLPPLTASRDGALSILVAEAKDILGLPQSMLIPPGTLADKLRREVFRNGTEINTQEAKSPEKIIEEIFGEELFKL